MLTSIHSTPGRGPYGSARFRGNCSGLLIRDLLAYFRPGNVLDPMTGSGTCMDVCEELNIPCRSLDLSSGFDACQPGALSTLGAFDFIWRHPPYWNLIAYNDDACCLSQAATLEEYVTRVSMLIANCRDALASGGKLAILIGDICRHGAFFALPFHIMNSAMAADLELAAPEIIRFAHGTSSSKKHYSSRFIPRLHDICFILRPKRLVAERAKKNVDNTPRVMIRSTCQLTAASQGTRKGALGVPVTTSSREVGRAQTSTYLTFNSVLGHRLGPPRPFVADLAAFLVDESISARRVPRGSARSLNACYS